jgi:hypothetical protein
MLSTIGSRTALSLPDRHRGTKDPDSKSNDGATDDKLRKSKRRRTQTLAHQRQGCSKENVLAPTENISNVHASEGASEGSQNEGGYYSSLDCCIVALHLAFRVRGINFRERLGPVGELSKYQASFT